MFAPQLYTVRKFSFDVLAKNNFNLELADDEIKKYYINQQDNMLFRQIRLITGNINKLNPYIVFVHCKNVQNKKEELEKLFYNGFILNGKRFVVSERSSSMVRYQTLSFVDADIIDKLNQRVSLDIKTNKTVLSKYYAYRGLLLSSCHNIEHWYPKVIVVPDYFRTIKDQKIKYAYDSEVNFTDKKTGQLRTWKQKDIAEKISDIEINVFDGCGIHHPDISTFLESHLNPKDRITSVLWRAPFIKGVTHEINYTQFFEERNIFEIRDIWGAAHSIYDPMIIMTESMYKGFKYFKHYNDYRDWENYWNKFIKYDHCIGVARWNFSFAEEPIYTRANYQILQDLELDYAEFRSLADYMTNWVEKIIDGDMLYTYCFLGLFADKCKPLNYYTKSILKNPEMLKEYGVRQYFLSLVEKYIKEMHIGKLYIKACNKFVAPDLIMLLEHIGKCDNVSGCLNEDEFFSIGYSGEYLIERNPHICRSEHTILKAIDNELIRQYCSHLNNVCMINGKSITMPRLNGADADGDLVLVVDNKTIMSGVDRNAPVVIDIEDKITSMDEEDDINNRFNLLLRTLHNIIGETSNNATTYHNKCPQTVKQKRKYESYVDLLSIINGKAIDFAKTGIIYNIPKHISKYSKPLPYFMKYKYTNYKEFSRSNSNMNRLCFDLEKWYKHIRFKREYKNFDYKIMIDNSISINNEIFSQIEEIFFNFCKEMQELAIDQNKLHHYDDYRDEFDGLISRENALLFTVNWNYYYDIYKNKCLSICNGNKKLLANIAVILCYEKYPKKNKKFLWRVAGDGIVNNIKQVSFKLPIHDVNGAHVYLGKRYSMVNPFDLELSFDLEEFNI